MIAPTKRAILLAAATVPLSLVAVATSAGYWPLGVVSLAAVALAALADIALGMPIRTLDASVEPVAATYIGEAAVLNIALRTSWKLPPRTIEAALDHDILVKSPTIARADFAPYQAVAFATPLTPLRRGRTAISALWLRWTGPLGLVRRQRRIALNINIAILPNIRSVRDAAIRLDMRNALFGSKAQNIAGDGSDFEALRDYQPGLDRRSIDWKHSARHRRLVCKEFKAERNHQIILAFDTGHLMREPLAGIPKLDHAINAGLLLSYASLKSGDRVGLVGFDSEIRQYAEPVGGMDQFRRLQRLVAELDYSTAETNFTLNLSELTGRLVRRSLIVLMTEFVDTVTAELMLENVSKLSKRHLILFVALQDPDLAATVGATPSDARSMATSVVAEELQRERMVVFERLRRLGVQCLEASHRGVSTELVSRYLEIKRLEMI